MFTFSFSSNFPTLIQSDFDNAYNDVSVLFSGCLGLWKVLSLDIQTAKRTLLTNYLVGWYLADMHPDKVVGIVADGGKPLTNKSIGGTSISFLQTDTKLQGLTSNTFGLKALSMIQTAPEMLGIYG